MPVCLGSLPLLCIIQDVRCARDWSWLSLL